MTPQILQAYYEMPGVTIMLVVLGTGIGLGIACSVALYERLTRHGR